MLGKKSKICAPIEIVKWDNGVEWSFLRSRRALRSRTFCSHQVHNNSGTPPAFRMQLASGVLYWSISEVRISALFGHSRIPLVLLRVSGVICSRGRGHSGWVEWEIIGKENQRDSGSMNGELESVRA